MRQLFAWALRTGGHRRPAERRPRPLRRAGAGADGGTGPANRRSERDRPSSSASLRLRGEQGQILVLGALMMATLLAMAGLALDFGMARVEQQQAQAAADAAAMAGADDLPGSVSTALADALGSASSNGFVNAVDGVTVSAYSPPVHSQSHNGDANSVEVDITAVRPTFLLRVLHIDTLTTSVQAVATASPHPLCVVCVLSQTAPESLYSNSTTGLTITGGNLADDSSASNAIALDGGTSVTAPGIGVVGGYQLTNGSTLSPTPVTGIQPVPDPLASVPPPAIDGPIFGPVSLGGSDAATIEPGIYTCAGTSDSYSLDVSGSATLTLDPGTYVLTCPVILGGSGSTPRLIGQGVTLYFTCLGYSEDHPAPCDGSAGAGLTVNGDATYDLTPPTSGTYQGLTVFYDRGNTAPLVLNGNAATTFDGTVYAKSAAATLNGNPEIDQMDSMIIANTVALNGNGSVNIAYTSGDNYPVPGSSVLTE